MSVNRNANILKANLNRPGPILFNTIYYMVIVVVLVVIEKTFLVLLVNSSQGLLMLHIYLP